MTNYNVKRFLCAAAMGLTLAFGLGLGAAWNEAKAEEPEWVIAVNLQIQDWSSGDEEPVAVFDLYESTERRLRTREACARTAEALGALLSHAMTSAIVMDGTPEKIGHVAFPIVSCFSPSREVFLHTFRE